MNFAPLGGGEFFILLDFLVFSNVKKEIICNVKEE